MSNQKGVIPLGLIIVLLLVTATGIYVSSQNKKIFHKPETTEIINESSSSGKEKNESNYNATFSGKITNSGKQKESSPNGHLNNLSSTKSHKEKDRYIFPCFLSLKIPKNWKILYNPTCIEIAAPDFEIVENPRPGVLSEEVGLKLTIGYGYYPTDTQIYINGGYQNITIKDLNSYIDSKKGDFNEISNVEDKIYGNIKGKFYTHKSIYGTGIYRRVSDFSESNFIFQDGNIIYHATWPDRYEAGHEDELNDILSSIEIVKR